MHGYNYHFTMNPAKQTIKLRPTAGTYAKALLPSVVIFLGFAAVGLFVENKEKKQDLAIDDLKNE